MTLATLRLHIDASGIIEELVSVCEVAGYEVTFPTGNVCVYGASDRQYVDETFGLDPDGHFKVEPLYRFKKAEADPNQPGLFEESAK